MSKMSVLKLANINHSFKMGASKLHVLHDICFELKPGEIVALVGASGAGKSTLLQIAGLLEKPSSGNVIINGITTANIKDKSRTELRRDAIGFVYQFHHLLPEFSALENIMMPLLISNENLKQAHKIARKLLDTVGLTQRSNHKPSQLSGGEQQRIAIARAMANNPKILLADEPTGNLDSKNSENVFSTLLALIEQNNICALIATHNLSLAKRMTRILELKDGKLHQA